MGAEEGSGGCGVGDWRKRQERRCSLPGVTGSGLGPEGYCNCNEREGERAEVNIVENMHDDIFFEK
jgi:hypothetical protein